MVRIFKKAFSFTNVRVSKIFLKTSTYVLCEFILNFYKLKFNILNNTLKKYCSRKKRRKSNDRREIFGRNLNNDGISFPPSFLFIFPHSISKGSKSEEISNSFYFMVHVSHICSKFVLLKHLF